MRIAAQYSHLNGWEFLFVHHKDLLQEIEEVIASVDAEACRTKLSREKTKIDRLLYSPVDMNKAIADGFKGRRWEQRRQEFWVTSDAKIVRDIASLPALQQKETIKAAGQVPIRSYNQTDFVKERVAVEVQFGKYAFVAHDLFVKHMAFFVSDDALETWRNVEYPDTPGHRLTAEQAMQVGAAIFGPMLAGVRGSGTEA